MEDMMAEVTDDLEQSGVDIPQMLKEENEKRQQDAANFFIAALEKNKNKAIEFISTLEELD